MEDRLDRSRALPFHEDAVTDLQLGTVTGDGFELMFGDCGRVYFCIRKEDLAARRFDRVWLILQCG